MHPLGPRLLPCSLSSFFSLVSSCRRVLFWVLNHRKGGLAKTALGGEHDLEPHYGHMALQLLILCVALLPAFAVGAEEAVQLDVALRKSANQLSNISASFYQESPSDDVFLNVRLFATLFDLIAP